MQIFDRWGGIINDQESDVSEKPELGSWDGTYKTCITCDIENAPDGVLRCCFAI